MRKSKYFIDDKGDYVTHELLRSLSEVEKCPFCNKNMQCVFAEKYLKFENGVMMIIGLKIYGHECDTCNCGFIYLGKQ